MLSQEAEQLEHLDSNTLDTYAQAELTDMNNTNYMYTTIAYGIIDETELKQMTVAELDRLTDDLSDASDMYPNGRDYDAEDEDCP